MNATKTKTNIPLISGPYYKELLREMKIIGIIFAVLQFLLSFSFAFGNGVSFLLNSFSGGLTKYSFMLYYFFVAALNFLNGHVKRGSWDFRGSLPIAKKTMAATHIAVTLTFAAIIFAAHFLGVLMGELIIRLPGIHITQVPPAIGATALAILNDTLRGIVLYCGLMIIGSVTVSIFSIIVAALVVAVLPQLYITTASNFVSGGFSIAELLLPIGLRGREALSWVALVIEAAIVIVLGVIAYSYARAETFGKPARTNWIHIAIGVGLAAVVGLGVLNLGIMASGGTLFEILLEGSDYSGTGLTEIGPTIIAALILMFLAYFFYMWLTLHSFVKALKRLAFLPIAVALVASVALLAVIANKKLDRIDFREANIDHITIMDGTFENGAAENWDIIFNLDSGNNPRGSTGAEKIKLRDPQLIKLFSQYAEELKMGGESNSILGSYISSMLGYKDTVNAEITLKDGTTWSLPVGRSFVAATAAPYALKDKAYVEKFTDVSRFRGGRVFAPNYLGKEFADTLLDELAALSPEDRVEIFSDSLSDYPTIFEQVAYVSPVAGSEPDDESTVIYYPENTVNAIAVVTLVSPTYDNVAILNITDKLPKTKALYIRLANEHTRSLGKFDEVVARLENYDFTAVYGEIITDGTTNNFNIVPNTYEYDKEYEPPLYTEQMKQAAAILAAALKRELPEGQTEGITCIKLNEMGISAENKDGNSWREYKSIITSSDDFSIFVRLTPDEAEALDRIFMFSRYYDDEPVEIEPTETSYGNYM